MEGVDHVDVVEVGGRRLVRQVDRVLERQVPDGEGLKLGVPGLDAALVLMVQLRKADRHLAAAGARRRHDDERALRLDVIVFAVALVADDVRHVVGVPGDLVMAEGADAQRLQAFLKRFDLGRGGVHRHADAAHKQPHALERVDQPQNVHIVGDAVVAAQLAADDILGIDGDDDLGLVFQLQQHLQLGVRLEPRQHARGVVVVKQFAAKLHVQFVVKLGDPLPDMGRLHRQIFVVVKSQFHIPLISSLCSANKNIQIQYSIPAAAAQCADAARARKNCRCYLSL